MNSDEMSLLTHPEYARKTTMLYHVKAMDHIPAMDTNKDGKISWGEYWTPTKKEAQWDMKAIASKRRKIEMLTGQVDRNSPAIGATRSFFGLEK